MPSRVNIQKELAMLKQNYNEEIYRVRKAEQISEKVTQEYLHMKAPTTEQEEACKKAQQDYEDAVKQIEADAEENLKSRGCFAKVTIFFAKNQKLCAAKATKKAASEAAWVKYREIMLKQYKTHCPHWLTDELTQKEHSKSKPSEGLHQQQIHWTKSEFERSEYQKRSWKNAEHNLKQMQEQIQFLENAK